MLTFTVSKTSGSREHFSTIKEALAGIPQDTCEPVTIFIRPGVYYEKLELSRPYVTLIGESAESVVIAWGDHANQLMDDGSKRGTFRSYTMLLQSHDITLSALTIRNTSAPRSKAGQAIALYADGDRLAIKDCRLESFQDTLFTGPLPPNPLTPGGFTGPGEFRERIVGRQFYQNCRICGDIDFIFGSATAWFEDCEIKSVYSEPLTPDKDGNPPVYGYVTAASTYEEYPYGYVFHHCRFTGTSPKGSVYLGRPWRNYARTVLLNCHLGSHIKKEGFHDWNKKEARSSILYAEYQSTGEGAAPEGRAPFVKQLTCAEASAYTIAKVLSGTDNWLPGS